MLNSELPSSVVEPRRFDTTELNAPLIVVEPVTASEVEVAPCNDVAPLTVKDASVEAPAVSVPKLTVPSALKTPVMVEEPVTASAEVVPEPKEKLPPVMRPVLEMVKSVEVAKVLVVELIEKSVVGIAPVVDEAAKSERSAYGELVPRPSAPVAVKVDVPVLPKAATLARRLPVNSLVVVAFWSVVLPVTVSDASVEAPAVTVPRFTVPSALKTPLIVVEPVTASEVEVAPWSDVAPLTVRDASVEAPAVRVPKVAPPTALNWPATVLEPVVVRLVPVAMAKSKAAKCEVEEAKRPEVTYMGVEVAEVLTPKLLVGVNSNATFPAA